MTDRSLIQLATARGSRLLSLSLCVALLSACAVGPDYQRPQTAEIAQFKEAEGWRQAQREAGLSPNEDWLLESDFSSAGGYETARQLLRHLPEVTALFAATDLMAIGALRAVAEAGRRVPEDVSIVGFDDIELAGFVHPALTTVGCSIKELGREAGRALLARIEQPQASLREVLMKPQLVRRESTAAPAGGSGSGSGDEARRATSSTV